MAQMIGQFVQIYTRGGTFILSRKTGSVAAGALSRTSTSRQPWRMAGHLRYNALLSSVEKVTTVHVGAASCPKWFWNEKLNFPT